MYIRLKYLVEGHEPKQISQSIEEIEEERKMIRTNICIRLQYCETQYKNGVNETHAE